MNKIVYLIYEVEKRELLSRLFLGHKIVSDIPGAKIVIIQHSELFKIALFRRPGIVILKSCPIQYLRILKIMKLRGFQIILSQEEGIHYSELTSEQLEFSTNCAKYIDIYLAWHQADSLFAQKMGIDKGRILIVGNVRFELARKMFFGKFNNSFSELRILVLENFSMRSVYKKYNVDSMQFLAKSAQNSILVHLEKMIYAANLNEKMYLATYEEFRKNSIGFVVRKYTLRDNSEKHPLTFYDEKSNILESLECCNVVVHYGSTAGLEAILSGRLSLILSDHRVKVYDERIGKSSFEFTKIPDLINYLAQINQSTLNEDLQKQFQNLCYAYGMSENSFESSVKIVEVIVGINTCTTSTLKNRIYFVSICFPLAIKSLILFLARKNSKVNPKASKILLKNLITQAGFLGINLFDQKVSISRNRKSLNLKSY